MMKIGKKILENKLEDFIIVSEELPIDYDDITSILNIIKIGELEGKDYKWIREQLKIYGNSNDNIYSGYTNIEKFELCTRKATSEQRRKDFLGTSHNGWMSEFDVNSQDARKKRFSIAKSYILNNLVLTDAFLILDKIKVDSLESDYINHGVEGTISINPDGIEALLNFVDATSIQYYITNLDILLLYGIHDDNGTIKNFKGEPVGKYELTGLAAMTLTFLPGSEITTKSDLVNKIMDCLKNGNY